MKVMAQGTGFESDNIRTIVGIVVLRDQIFVATTNKVYVKGEDNIFYPLKFDIEEDKRNG